MSSPIMVQGTVVNRERVRTGTGEYTLIYLKNRARPLAIKEGSVWPPNGAVVNCRANPGTTWDFAVSREISVDPSQSPPYDLEKRIPGMAQLLAPLVLDWLRWNRTCTSDDIHDQALGLIGDRDHRVIGTAFSHLAHRRIIKRVGIARSKREVNHHNPVMSVWELRLKPEA